MTAICWDITVICPLVNSDVSGAAYARQGAVAEIARPAQNKISSNSILLYDEFYERFVCEIVRRSTTTSKNLQVVVIFFPG